MKNRDHVASIAIMKVAALLCGVAVALAPGVGYSESDDHTVIARESLTVQQLVELELQSSKFAKQIATYNGIETVSTLLPAGAILQIPKPYILDLDFGRVAFVKGDVIHAQKDLVVNPPARGSRIFNGDVFSTGSDGFVSLSFSSGISVNLQPESRATVVDVDCVDAAAECVVALLADKGQISSEVTPRPAGEPQVKFSVETPFLSAAVRGTAFYVDVEEGVNRVGVTRGLVAAASNGIDSDLPKGKGLVALPGEDPAVVDLPAAPELSGGSSSDGYLLSVEDVISWNAIAGAEKYIVMFATDPGMADVISRQEVQDSFATPDVNAVGEYHLSVAAVDDQGVQGLPLNMQLTYASISDVEPLELQIQRAESAVRITTDYSDTVELSLSHSIDGVVTSRRLIDDLSSGISLALDPQVDWVFRARKVLGETAVSRYGNEYLLKAVE